MASEKEVIETAQELSRQIDEHEAYKIAGALFGHLRKALGFGYLTMSTPEHLNAVVFQWVFTSAGKRHSQQEAIPLEDLPKSNHIKEHAQYLALRWKRAAREVTPA